MLRACVCVCVYACECMCVCVLVVLGVGSTEATDVRAVVICTRASPAVCEVFWCCFFVLFVAHMISFVLI